MDFQCREVDHFRVFPCFNRKIGCPSSRYYYRVIESPENDQALLENNYVIHLDSPVLTLNVKNLLKQNFCVNVFQKQFIIHVEKLEKLIKTYAQNGFSMVPSHIVYFSVCLMGDAETASLYSYDLQFDLQQFSWIKMDQLYTENRSEPDSSKDYHLAVVAKLKTTLELKLEIILTEISSSYIRCDITDGNIYRSRSGLSCTNCVNALEHCEFRVKGCSFVDTYTKVEIHRKWHCNYNRICTICNRRITSPCLQQHYQDNHCTNLIEQHQKWTDIMLQTYFIIDHTIGFLICEYKECYDFNNEKYLEFKVHSDKRSGDLYRYQCRLIYCTSDEEENDKILELGSCNNRVEKYSDWSTRIYLSNININSFQIDLIEKYPVFEHNE